MYESRYWDHLDTDRICANCGTVRHRDEMVGGRLGDLVCWACPCKSCGDPLTTGLEKDLGVCTECVAVLADELVGVAA